MLKIAVCLGKGQHLSVSVRNVDFLRDGDGADRQSLDTRMSKTGRAPQIWVEVTRCVGRMDLCS